MSEHPEVEVRRSTRRRKTVSAYRRDGKVVVLIPASFTRAQEERYVADMLQRLERQGSRRRGEEELEHWASRLSDRYLGGRARPASVRWVSNMTSRWGSCTTTTGEIRLSDRLAGYPEYVVEYVLLHELAHLLQPGHDAAFWELVDAHPRAERAKGFLDGVTHA